MQAVIERQRDNRTAFVARSKIARLKRVSGIDLLSLYSGRMGMVWLLWAFSLVAVASSGGVVKKSDKTPAAEFVSVSKVLAGANSVRRVRIKQFVFQPRKIVVSRATTVIWTNDDRVKHDVTFQDRNLQSELFGHGQSLAVTFHEAGNYGYYCHVHPFMEGSVKVVNRTPANGQTDD